MTLALQVFWGLLAAIWLLDALRLRARAAHLARLAPSDEPASPEHTFLTAPGLELDEGTRRAASAFARREHLEVVDLVPHDLPTWRSLFLLASVDPAVFRADSFGKGRSAGYALLVHTEVLARASVGRTPAPGPGAIFEWAAHLKHYAPATMDLAVAPGLEARSVPDGSPVRRALVAQLFGGMSGMILGVQALLIGLGVAGPLFGGWAGLAALGLFHLQPLLIFPGTALLPRDVLWQLILRVPLDLLAIARTCWSQGDGPRIAALRPGYQEAWAKGAEGFFEPRREDCPLCGGKDLAPRLKTVDLLQQKPGRFVLERCRACRHIFQNPRLSLAGLGYYYGDFYDGLGEAGIETIFAYSPVEYVSRAKVVEGLVEPKRWLDVGAGHGHFALVARGVWPGARMDGLDLSESIEEAARRRWIDTGYRGLFPELAPALAAQGLSWDVVSMSHYLEHTRDPRAEIAAAHQVVADGGVVFIEIPDPDSRLQHLLGRYWTPWFQPQHQHFVSVANVERLLREAGFEPVRWHRGESHRPVDFMLGAVLFLKDVLPAGDQPWRTPPSAPMRLLGGLLWTLGLPLVGLGWLTDRVLTATVLRRAGWSNAFRVVARKVPRP